MKILLNHATINELGRLLVLNLKRLGKTRYSAKVERVLITFQNEYSPEISNKNLDELKKFQKNLDVIKRIKESDKITPETIEISNRLLEETERLIFLQEQNSN